MPATIFQAGSTLTTAPGSRVTLTGGTQACNVFWQVGSSATLDTGSVFRGTVLAMTSITANTGATIEGRLLARGGAVTLDTNTVTRPSCVTAPTAAATVAAAAPQVTAVPSGPVSAGDGSTAPGTTTSGAGYLGAGAAIVALSIAAFVVARRRRVDL